MTIYDELIKTNEKYFYIFCHKCFKLVGKDFSKRKPEEHVEDEILVMLIARYFFML
jgi:hypothetical protein